MKISQFILYDDSLLVLGDSLLPLLFLQCKFCGREGTVTMISGRGKLLNQEDSESGKYCPMMLFDCRGYEPVDFIFGGGWKVESVSFRFLSFHFVIQHGAPYIFLPRIMCGCKGCGTIHLSVYNHMNILNADMLHFIWCIPGLWMFSVWLYLSKQPL